MMTSSLPFLLLTLATVLAAPQALNDDYSQVIIPQKRAALVLDRLLVALQKALREDGPQRYARPDRDGPRAAPLHVNNFDDNNMMALSEDGGARAEWRGVQDTGPRFAPLRIDLEENTSALQRRTGTGRGRVLRCYFNAVTCF